MFETISDDDRKLLQDAKEKLMKDIRETPMSVLMNGTIISYNLDPNGDPIISKIVILYKEKEYIFMISEIKVKERGEKRD
jgi:hypothetical protein